ncbi:MAG: hypothetical protein LBU04_00590 [Christensenellaceae bacterium]|jgi:hypothetical protein|nr:hypothetical protein [Christensenellaceae bacterium]
MSSANTDKQAFPHIKYKVNSKRRIAIIISLIIIVAFAITAAILIPRLAPIEDGQMRKIVTIVPENDAQIGLNADLNGVNVKIMYNDGTSEIKALSELIVVGLDTSEPGKVENVYLTFGGFIQPVSYTVLPIEKVVKYLALQGGSIEGDTEQHIPSGGNASTVRAVADEGYKFSEWSDGVKQAQRTDTFISQDKELTAQFVRIRYTVIFYFPDGTMGREQEIEHGYPATSVPSPETDKEMQLYGYRFIGWNIDAQELKSVTRRLDVYPQYEKYASDFVLDITKGPDGTSLGTSPDLKSYYTNYEIGTVTVLPNPERTFIGWEILTINGWQPLAVAENSTSTIRTSYSIYTENNYIEFISSKNGLRDEFFLSFTPNIASQLIEVRANFVYNSSTISFISMSTIAHAPVLIERGVSIGEYFNALTSPSELFNAVEPSPIDGYLFAGWFINNGPIDAYGKPVLITNATTFDIPTELVAYWEKRVYEIVFTRGASESFSEKRIQLYWQDVLGGEGDNAFPIEIPFKPNYNFIGWYRIENGAETDKFVDKSTRVDGDMRLYPKFSVNTKELTIDLTGSGVVSISRSGGVAEKLEKRTIQLAVDEIYVITFTANEGYSIVEMTVSLDGGVENKTPLNESVSIITLGQGGIITHSYYYSVVFKKSRHVVTVYNGTQANSGKIVYEDVFSLDDNGNPIQIETDASVFTIEVPHGSGRMLWLTAPEGYHIDSITIAGVSVSNIPQGASQYATVVSEVRSGISVYIGYRPITYISTLLGSGVNGILVARNPEQGSIHGYGETPQFNIEAYRGYYVESVLLDGVAVDPYTKNSNQYDIANLIVLGKLYNSSESGIKDERVEKYYLTIKNRTTDFTLQVRFASIYYKISTVANGFGTVTAGKDRVNYGGDVVITATTLSNYYVAYYRINNSETPVIFEGNAQSSSQSFKLISIDEDKSIEVKFSAQTYTVTFSGASGTANVSYSDISGENIYHLMDHSALVKAGSNMRFVITPVEGSIIRTIEVDGVSERMGYNMSSHEIVFNNVRTSHEVMVTTFLVQYNITPYLANQGDDSMLDGNGETLSEINYATYLGGYDVIVTPGAGRSLDANNILIKHASGSVMTNLTINVYPYGPDSVRLLISGINDNAEIYIPLIFSSSTPSYEPFTLKLHYDDDYGDVTLLPTGYTNTTDKKNYTVLASDTTTFIITPIESYILKYITINGSRANVNEGATEFIYSGYSSNVDIEFIFDRKLFTITLSQSGAGSFSTDVMLFSYMQEIALSIIPSQGYKLSEFLYRNADTEYKDKGLNEVVNLVEKGEYVYSLNGLYAISDLMLTVKFIPLAHELKIILPLDEGVTPGIYGHLDNQGITIDQIMSVEYGQLFGLNLLADPNCYIRLITIKYNYGTPLETQSSIFPDELSYLTDSDIIDYRRVAGKLNFTVTSNMLVKIVFTPNRYTATVIQTTSGKTEIRSTNNTIFSSTAPITLYANETLIIRMSSNFGYHISNLFINGIAIDDWRQDSDPNNNRIIEYNYSLADKSVGTYIVYAEYQINRYDINYVIVNESVNYKAFDLNSTQFGVFRADGLVATLLDTERGLVGVFESIEHGADITFRFAPVKSKGYYVSLFIIKWIDPEDPNTAAPLNDNFTTEAQDIGYFIKRGITSHLEISIEFKRITYDFQSVFSVDQGGTTFISDGDMIVTFTNPNSGRSEDIVAIDGNKIEYGTTYNVLTIPGTGYSATSFNVNGVEQLVSLRGNRYFGDLRSDVTILAIYTIKTYDISFASTDGFNISDGGFVYIYSSDNSIMATDGNLIWTNDPTMSLALGKFSSQSGEIIVYLDHINVTHNTEIIYEFNPLDDGYYVSSVILNGRPQTITVVLGDTYSFSARSTNTNILSVDFAFIQLSVTIDALERTSATEGLPSDLGMVPWAGTVYMPINARLREGYFIKNIYVYEGAKNEDSRREISSEIVAIINNSRSISFDVNNVKSDVIIEIIFDRYAYDIEYADGFDAEFDIGHGNVNKVKSIAGVLIGGTDRYFSQLLQNTHPAYSILTPTGTVDFTDVESNAIRGLIKYGQSIVYYFVPVDGYRISSIRIVMNGVEIVASVSLLQNHSDEGYYSYSIPAITGAIRIAVTYAVKSYSVEFSSRQNGYLTSTQFSTINHHALLSMSYVASIGYHLESLTVNGLAIQTMLTIAEGSYQYSANFYITSVVGTIVRIEPQFSVNVFNTKISVNGIDVGSAYPDTTLIPSLDSTSGILSHTAHAVINQQRAEGYSITNISLSNSSSGTPITAPNAFSIWYDKPTFEFDVSTYAINLNYHDPAKNTLYIAYTTSLNMHTSQISSYLYETESGNSDVPANSFVLTSTYSSTSISGKYDYFTIATFNLILSDSDKYYFAGYQENTNGAWSYVSDSQNGITLLNSGYTLRYQTTADRVFRAIIYRYYDIKVMIYPDYKYIEGSYNTTNTSMVYRRYTTITAVARFTADNRPNLQDNALSYTLTDTDLDATNGSAVYRVYSGTTLTIAVADTYQDRNSTKSYAYYYYNSADQSETPTTEVTVASGGKKIEGNMTINIYAGNAVKESIGILTEGSSIGTEGGTVEYFVGGNRQYLESATSAASLSPKAELQIVITPKANFRFESVTFRNYLPLPNANGERQLDTTWTTVADNTMSSGSIYSNHIFKTDNLVRSSNIFTVDIVKEGTRITKVTIKVVVRDNLIFNIKFWKQIEVSGGVRLFDGTETTGDTGRDGALLANLNNAFRFQQGMYDYGKSVTAELDYNAIIFSDEWSTNYRFIGFYISGVNTYERLGQSFPVQSEYTKDIRIDNTISITGGTGTPFAVSVIAMFIPVINVVIENTAMSNLPEYSRGFDFGNISVETNAYTSSRLQYYSSVSNIRSYSLSNTSNYSKTLRAASRINSISGTPADYNAWNTNFISLTWVDENLPYGVNTSQALYADKYTFNSWQFYNPYTDKWEDIQYTDPVNVNNKPSSVNFRFPVGVLLNNSYIGATDSVFDRSLTYADIQGTGTLEQIHAVRIRPFYRRKESITISPLLYMENENSASQSGSNEVSPRFDGGDESVRESQFLYGTISSIMHGSRAASFEILGWYVNGTQVTNQVSGRAEFETSSFSYAVITSSNNLIFRAIESFTFEPRYIKIWSITITTVNDSSNNNSYVSNSTPLITQLDASGTAVGVAQRSLTTTLRAGTEIQFMLLKPTDTSYDSDYDKYVSSMLNIAGNASTPLPVYNTTPSANISAYIRSTSNNDVPSTWRDDQSGLLKIKYVIVADKAMKIEIHFKIYGEIVVNKIYAGSTLVIPESLARAISLVYGEWDPLITDNSSRDLDNELSVIRIQGIPVGPQTAYNEPYEINGEVFSGIANRIRAHNGTEIDIYCTNIQLLFLDFSGDLMGRDGHNKKQEFSFYSDADDETYGVSGHNQPLASAFTSSAGDGSSSNPFKVSNSYHMEFIDTLYTYSGGTLNGLYFKQIANINLSGHLQNGIAGDMEIGGGFDAEFDGGGYALYNWSVINSSQDNVGIFSRLIQGAKLLNIAVGGSTLSVVGKDNVGYLVGLAQGDNNVPVQITNIKAYGGSGIRIVNGVSNVGGIIGSAQKNVIIDGGISNGGGYGILPSFVVYGLKNAGGAIGLIGAGAIVKSLTVNSPEIVLENNNTGVPGSNAGGVAGSAVSDASIISAEALLDITVINPKVLGEGIAVGGVLGLNSGRTIKNISISGLVSVYSKENTINNPIFNTYAPPPSNGDEALGTQRKISVNSIYSSENASFGAGGVVGINDGLIESVTYMTANALHELRGSVLGGVAGINTVNGVIRNTNTLSARFISEITHGSGGIYAVQVGLNFGTVQGAITKGVSLEANQAYDFLAHHTYQLLMDRYAYLSPNSVGEEMGYQKLDNDPTTLYLGGIVGYNVGGGVVSNSEFKGTLITNRYYNSQTSNFVNIGAIAGATEYTNAGISSNKVQDIRLYAYALADVDCSANSVQDVTYSLLANTIADNATIFSNNTISGTNKIGLRVCAEGSYHVSANIAGVSGLASFYDASGRDFRETLTKYKVNTFGTTVTETIERGSMAIATSTGKWDQRLPGVVVLGFPVTGPYYDYDGSYRRANIVRVP